MITFVMRKSEWYVGGRPGGSNEIPREGEREGLTRVDGDFRGSALKIAGTVGGIAGLEVGVESPASVGGHGVRGVAGASNLKRAAIHLPLIRQRPTHPVQRSLQR